MKKWVLAHHSKGFLRSYVPEVWTKRFTDAWFFDSWNEARKIQREADFNFSSTLIVEVEL